MVAVATAITLALTATGCHDDRPAGPTSPIVGVDRLAEPPAGRSWAPAPRREAGLSTLARADAGGFALRTAHGDVRFLAGVNLGSTTPGYQPGELAIGPEDYREWFPAMGRLGIRMVRIYTIHPPDFYRELHAYNRAHPDRPLYLVQGVYLPDESYVENGNLYRASVTESFRGELRDAVDAVYGQLDRAERRGRAAGRWDTDVSAWLVAWIIGVEWDPDATHRTDEVNARAPGHAGRYFASTKDASPTERWLAARMDEVATAEATRGGSRPIAFTNWPTVDPLRHPDEPLAREDLVGVDANHVLPTSAWPGGTFASYHAYPYYPDFQRHEPALRRYIYNGQSDPYAGYLDALKRHHAGMPVIVTETGVPSALGTAHFGPLGRHQGSHEERAAMRIDADLLRLIRDVGLSGGLLFAWTDEWFKVTWNTVAHQPADRGQLWHDPLTNEEHFGLVATDPTGALNPDPRQLGDGVGVRVDEAYLHLTVPGVPAGPVTIGLNAVAAIEGPPPPGSADRAADTAVVLDTTARSGRVWVREELDPTVLDYELAPGARPDPVGGWRPFQLITNRPLTVPSTGRRLPVEFQDVGLLRYGNWDPADPAYDSLATWRLDGDVLRIRLPWAFAGLADPSSRLALLPDSPQRTVPTAGIGLTVRTATAALTPGLIEWEPWQRVGYQERLKAGAEQVRQAMLDVAP